jgi:hypothetical protein
MPGSLRSSIQHAERNRAAFIVGQSFASANAAYCCDAETRTGARASLGWLLLNLQPQFQQRNVGFQSSMAAPAGKKITQAAATIQVQKLNVCAPH